LTPECPNQVLLTPQCIDTSLNVTKLDVLDSFPTIKIAVAYLDPVTGEELASFPADLELLGR